MRQMVLGAVVAFALTVVVISFLSPKGSEPAVADAGSAPVAAVANPDAGQPPHRVVVGGFKATGIFNHRMDHPEVLVPARPQVHVLVTDAGR